jgi:hypothetical protein
MAQTTYIARKGFDADFADITCDSITVAGVSVVTAVLLASGQVADLNGEADALVLDADADTTISSPTDDQIDFEINGADDFRMTANTFTALSGSSIETNTIAETTAASGVTIDGLLIKDGIVGTSQAITGDGAITIQNAIVLLSKAGAGAITIAAPTAGTHDGILIEVITLTAQAHVITSGVEGFNDKGSSGTVTFTAAIGNSVTLRAWNGNWYVVNANGVTVA